MRLEPLAAEAQVGLRGARLLGVAACVAVVLVLVAVALVPIRSGVVAPGIILAVEASGTGSKLTISAAVNAQDVPAVSAGQSVQVGFVGALAGGPNASGVVERVEALSPPRPGAAPPQFVAIIATDVPDERAAVLQAGVPVTVSLDTVARRFGGSLIAPLWPARP